MSETPAIRRQRALRALSGNLDASYGPDRAEVVGRFKDGWTIVRLIRLEDQRREGELMRNCLRNVRELDRNCYSLRDPDNVPHASFAAWAIDENHPLVPRLPEAAFTIARNAVMLAEGRARSKLKPEYAERLCQFGASEGAAVLLRPFPRNERDFRREVIAAIVPGPERSVVRAFGY